MSGWDDPPVPVAADTWVTTATDDAPDAFAASANNDAFAFAESNDLDAFDSKHAGGDDRAFTGECHSCGKEGHRASDCPNKPAELCNACGEEGHRAATCTGARQLYDDTTPILDSDEAWAAVKIQDQRGDLSKFRLALNAYTRVNPEMTFLEIEERLRNEKMRVFIIAKEFETQDIKTLVNLQGKIDCEFVVALQTTANPIRKKFADGHPATPEENKERLKNAGYSVDRMVPKCRNCKELGHIGKDCPQGQTVAAPEDTIVCSNCQNPGHFLRDCPEPRPERTARTCRNCNQEGHKAADCTEPRSAANFECRNCGETGHFARECPARGVETCHRCHEEGHRAVDCTVVRAPMVCHKCNQEGHKSSECTNEKVMVCRNCEKEGHISRECPEPINPANQQCRNCDKKGHHSRECPEPRDYSKIQCRNCGEFGHTKVRCRMPPIEDGDTGFGAADPSASYGFSASADADTSTAATGGWDSGATDAAASGGNAWDTVAAADADGNSGWDSAPAAVSVPADGW